MKERTRRGKYFIVLISIAVLLSFIGSSSLYAKSPVKKKPSSRKTSTPLIPFDRSVSKLPSNFKPSDPWALVAKYSNVNLEKDQYESSEKYRARLTSATKDLFALSMPSTQGSVELKYSADNQEYELIANLYGYGFFLQPIPVLYQSQEHVGSYRISTEQGPITVEKVKEAYLYFRTGTLEGFFNGSNDYGPMGENTSTITFKGSFKLDGNTAQQERNNTQILAIVRPIKSSLKTYTDKPTYDEPRETFVNSVFLVAEALEFWIVNIRTGDIYLKVTTSEEEKVKQTEQKKKDDSKISE